MQKVSSCLLFCQFHSLSSRNPLKTFGLFNNHKSKILSINISSKSDCPNHRRKGVIKVIISVSHATTNCSSACHFYSLVQILFVSTVGHTLQCKPQYRLPAKKKKKKKRTQKTKCYLNTASFGPAVYFVNISKNACCSQSLTDPVQNLGSL